MVALPFSLRPLLFLLLPLALVPVGPLSARQAGPEGPIELTREEDHRRTLDLLGIDALRRGADGSDTTSAFYANYDEASATPYPHLPDPLLTNDRRRVDTPELWWTVRRPELVEFFDREIYGRVPEHTPDVTWTVTNVSDTTIGSVPARVKSLEGRVDNSAYPAVEVVIEAVLTVPAGAEGPVPVVTQFGFLRLPPWLRDRPGGPPPGPDWRALVLAEGWGFAILSPNSVQADDGGDLTRGIIGLVNHGRPRALDDWGALRAWAWGASRLLDYFETDPDVDAERVGIQGHSRFGKAAGVAMAHDDRFAVAYLSSSGAGGVKLHRRDYGERVENVAGAHEYHWMAGNYLKYAGPLTWDDLPVDAHELIALMAPRPVFIGSGRDGDGWVDPRGMFLAGVHAGPVYELLGGRGLGTTRFPPVEIALLDGDIAFRQHGGGHTAGPNWPAFIEFARRYLDTPTTP